MQSYLINENPVAVCSGVFLQDEYFHLPICKYNFKDFDSIESSSEEIKVLPEVISKNIDCEKIETTKGSIYLCSKVESTFWDKTIEVSPTLGIALIAVIVSLSTLKFMRGQDKRNAIKSIDDEYLIRKIISPNIIESVFNKSYKIIEDISLYSINLEKEQKINLENHTNEFAAQVRIMLNFVSKLDVLNIDLKNDLKENLEKLEDILVNAAFQIKINKFNKNLTSAKISSSVNEILNSVRKYQVCISGIGVHKSFLRFFKLNYYFKKQKQS